MCSRNKKKGDNHLCIAKLLISVSFSFFLYSCAVVDARDPSAGQVTSAEEVISEPATTEPQPADKKANPDNQKAVEIAGAVLATIATVWVITEFIEEKVVPAVVGLTVAYLLYQAARNSESSQEN